MRKGNILSLKRLTVIEGRCERSLQSKASFYLLFNLYISLLCLESIEVPIVLRKIKTLFAEIKTLFAEIKTLFAEIKTLFAE